MNDYLVKSDGYQTIKDNKHKQATNPPTIPLRTHTFITTILLAYALFCLCQIMSEVSKNLKIILSAILEYTVLYLSIAGISIIIQTPQATLCHFIIGNILWQLVPVLHYHTSGIHRQRQTHITVNLWLFVQQHDRHRLQTLYQTVKTSHLYITFLHIISEWYQMTLKLLVLLLCFMTGVCQIKHIAFPLRVKHQSILVWILHGLHQCLEHILTSHFHHLLLLAVLVMICGQLIT